MVGIESGAVWVETVRQSTCLGCSARAGCGQRVLQRLGVASARGQVRALSDLPLAIGDTVILGLREDLLVKTALMFYLFPLLGLIAGALLAQRSGLGESWLMLSGVAGFLVSWLLVRRYSRRHSDDPALQPIVLRALIAGA